jgi:hypothetical protein
VCVQIHGKTPVSEDKVVRVKFRQNSGTKIATPAKLQAGARKIFSVYWTGHIVSDVHSTGWINGDRDRPATKTNE